MDLVIATELAQAVPRVVYEKVSLTPSVCSASDPIKKNYPHISCVAGPKKLLLQNRCTR